MSLWGLRAGKTHLIEELLRQPSEYTTIVIDGKRPWRIKKAAIKGEVITDEKAIEPPQA